MSTTLGHAFKPDYSVPPGATLRDLLKEIDVSQADLAARSGLSTKHINRIVQGIVPITHETALILERVTGMEAALWNALEANYRETLLRIRQRQLSKADQTWLASLPTKPLQDRSILPKGVSRGELFESALRFFGVADREAWERIWTQPVASFKRSPSFVSDPGAVASWLRIAQLEARKSKATQPYDASKFRSALRNIRSLTRKLDSDRLVEICDGAGVSVVFATEVQKSRISGATWWATPTRPVIALSDRHKKDDHFWFAFFHESAHVLLHSKKETFINDGSEDDGLESEANRVAADTLIPPDDAQRLPELKTTADVTDFAQKLGIAPGIVVGRLQHDRLWDWSKGNQLRRSIRIVED